MSTVDDNTGGSGDMISNKKECTSCEQQNDTDAIADDFNSMSILGDMSICASCGKESNSDSMNTCNKCKMVKYCNAACKKKHRTKHKKQCERRVAELHEEALFKQPPPRKDCPICFLSMPSLPTGSKYNSCCGKVICNGCIYAMKMSEGKDLCPFCRSPAANMGKEIVERVKKRVEINDPEAIFCLGLGYLKGQFGCLNGFNQDRVKALELYHRAGELGHAEAYYNIAGLYISGDGVGVDRKKAIHYWELAAMLGHSDARSYLGIVEANDSNWDRALKHWMIGAEGGSSASLKSIKQLLMRGKVTKDDYTKALRARQAYLDEIKSFQRDEAVAFNDVCKYY